jgi:hypothetical protein
MEEFSKSELENHKRLNEIEKSITKSLLYDDTNEIHNTNDAFNCMCSFKLALIISGIIFSAFLITFILFKK